MKFHYIIVLFLIFNPKTLADEFDFSFLNGTNQENAYLIENLSKNIIPGSYVLDVNLNNKYIGRRKITIDENDKDDICFEDDWLQSINFEINDVFYRGVLNIDDYCFYLNKELNTTVDFDYTTQSINFIIPQLGFGKEDKEQSSWDNGVGALRLNYNVNAFASETSTDIYSILDLKGNISDWVLSGSASLSNGDFYPSIGSAARPIKSLESDLIVGKMFTNSDILNGFGLTGLGLRKNTAQSGFDYGYKPIFSGTANSQALVSIIQNGVLIHSEVVSPGPFEIKNVSLLSSGDVSLVVKEKDGKETTRNIPLTISATMINPGDYDFDLYSGVRDEGDGQGLEGVFLSGSYGYGFEGLTLKGSTILHRNYFGLGFGFYKQLGHFGNIDIESSYSYSNNSLNKSEEGTSLSLTYEKAFNAHRRFVFSSDHYLSDRYIDFSSFLI
ncbi:fimbria/pilus outer membrane usher protein [Vibrio sp. nBUS_14]|uniref:fimbria/pilus outer membrane usher protein n=1 Tax=Vibrio sp. nBUS_14 TaxID=3395321 RepID=UPI003EBE4176